MQEKIRCRCLDCENLNFTLKFTECKFLLKNTIFVSIKKLKYTTHLVILRFQNKFVNKFENIYNIQKILFVIHYSKEVTAVSDLWFLGNPW